MKRRSVKGDGMIHQKWIWLTVLALAGLLFLGTAVRIGQDDSSHNKAQNSTTQEPVKTAGSRYPWHKQIFATIFWVGESADESNAYISNAPSAWIEDWQAAYGGIDKPEDRCSLLPCAFTPKENAFYFALPFNDRKDGASKPMTELRKIPWYTGGETPNVSWVKNRWIEVNHNNHRAYAQWEDVGPLHTDDSKYVFGSAQPKFEKSGLDLSPAITDYLGLNGLERVDWRFVDEADVPGGPWKNLVTTSPAEY